MSPSLAFLSLSLNISLTCWTNINQKRVNLVFKIQLHGVKVRGVQNELTAVLTNRFFSSRKIQTITES